MGTRIWDLYAPLYAFFTRSDERAYAPAYARIRHLIEGKRVLEVAAGPGTLAREVAPTCREMIATDFSAGMIRQARSHPHADHLRFEVADATALPYPDSSFDVVIIANALHIMPDPEAALGEAARVLRSDGILIAPNFVHGASSRIGRLRERILRLAGVCFEHEWTRDSYEEFLAANGWTVMMSRLLPTRIRVDYAECSRSDLR